MSSNKKIIVSLPNNTFTSTSVNLVNGTKHGGKVADSVFIIEELDHTPVSLDKKTKKRLSKKKEQDEYFIN